MEKKKPLLVLRGGGIVGGAVKFYPTFPLVSLRLDEDRIVLRVWPLREHTIPLADVETITLIQRPRFLYIPSVRIDHRSQAPAYIEFVSVPPRQIRQFVDKLREKSVRIDESKIRLTDRVMRRAQVTFFILATFVTVFIASGILAVLIGIGALLIQSLLNLTS